MAEVHPADTFDVDVVCPTCSERRYTSVRPLGLKETLSASLFTPVNDSPPMVDGQPLLCHECSSLMKFMKAAGTKPLPPRAVTEPQREVPYNSHVTTIFSVEPGEDLKSINDTPDGWIIVTNKRIVRVVP